MCTAAFGRADGKIAIVTPTMKDSQAPLKVPGTTYSAHRRRSDGSWEVVDTKLPRVNPGGQVLFLDATGDGLPDVVATGAADYGLRTFINKGGTFSATSVPSIQYDIEAPGLQETYFRFAVVLDYNGDGRQDLLMPFPGETIPNLHNAAPEWFILQAAGPAAKYTFEPKDTKIPFEAQIAEAITLADPRGPRIGDVNGDGAPDVLIALKGQVTIFENQAPDQDVLEAISDGRNEHEPDEPGFVPSIAVSYGHLNDSWKTNGAAPDDPALESYLYLSHADPANGCDYPRRCAVGPRRVVSGYAFNDGEGGQRKFGLRYRDGRYDRLGNGFLGFGTRILTDLDTGAGTIERYDNVTFIEQGELHVYPFAGLARKVMQFAPGLSGQPSADQMELSFLDITPTFVLTNGGKTYFTLTTERRYRREQGKWPSPQAPSMSLEAHVEQVEAQGGATMLRDSKTVISDFDEFGNVKIVDASTVGVDLAFHTERTFKNDTARWVLGQLQTQKECSSAAGKTQCRMLTRTTTIHGEVEAEKTETDDGSPQTKLHVVYGRDPFGNVESVSAKDEYGHHRASSTVYDPEGVYPVSETNAAGHTSLTAYDARFGALTKLTDPNGLITERQFDSLGQLVLETRSDGSQTSVKRERLKDGDVWRVSQRTTTTGGADDLVEFDSLGRPVRLFSYGPDTVEQAGSPLRQMQVIHYNRLNGKVARRSAPTEEGVRAPARQWTCAPAA